MPLGPKRLLVGFMRRELSIPRPSPQLALLVVVLWSLSLCFVDSAATLRVRRSMRFLDGPQACGVMLRPQPERVLRWLLPGERLWVRKMPQQGESECYELEDANGIRGYAPYNPAYLSSDGVAFRWRRLVRGGDRASL